MPGCEEGAHLYVCGDEKAMAQDVNEALIEMVGREGVRLAEAAEDYLRSLWPSTATRRDVY